jgi:site-specific DNA recombinase
VQVQIEQSATRRGQANSGHPTPPLAGKLSDTTGERLTPVHTQKAGRRYDYYISQSLKAAGAAEANGSGWRLPARALEDCINLALRRRLRTAILDGLAADADPQKISGLLARLDCDGFDLLAVIDRVCLGRHSLEISVDPHRLAQAFGISISFEDLELLTFQTPFTLRRRSVETKLLL